MDPMRISKDVITGCFRQHMRHSSLFNHRGFVTDVALRAIIRCPYKFLVQLMHLPAGPCLSDQLQDCQVN